MQTRPNILFVMADQMRADALGIVNGWTKTPHLDALAREGVLFAGVFSNSAECIPARFSLALGLYPHQTGVPENGTFTLNPECPNWMQAVERAGYQTSLFGKTHLHPHEGDLRDRLHLMHAYGLQVVDETTGPHASVNVRSHMTESWEKAGVWESYRQDVIDRVNTKRHVVRPTPLGLEHHYDVYVGRQAVRHLEALQGPRPWFCWVSFGGPHEPWDAPEPYASLYADAPIPPPTAPIRGRDGVRGLLRRRFDSSYYSPVMDPAEVRAIRGSYAGNVTLIDDQIGRILGVVRQRGEWDRTLVVFTSDHGEMNGDQGLLYKANFLDPAVRVPLIVRPPADGRPRTGGVDVVAELMDVGATIADYAGATLSGSLCGRSLRPVVEAKAAVHRDRAISEFAGHTALVDARFKIELAPDGGVALLFDRRVDKDEQVNLADDSASAGVAADLKARVAEFVAATPPPPVKATLGD